MILYIFASSRHVRLVHLVRTETGRYEESDVPETYPSGKVTVLRFDHLEFFAEVPLLDSLLPDTGGVRNAAVILTLRYIETLPSTTLKWLARYAKELRETGNLLLVAGVEPHVFELLERTEIINALGKENVFPAHRAVFDSMEAAMDRAQSWLREKD